MMPPEDLTRESEFRVPAEMLEPGMELARRVEHDGSTLIRSGVELDEGRIEQIRTHDVGHAWVNLYGENLDIYKKLLSGEGRGPTYEKLKMGHKLSLFYAIPDFAQPLQAARDMETGRKVEQVLSHVWDLLLGNSDLYGLCEKLRFFRHPRIDHSPLTTVYSLIIGASMGLELPALIDLAMCALFYDVGMLDLEADVVLKPGRLTSLEFGEIKKHPYFGRRKLQKVFEGVPSTAPRVALEHHESYYGGGYPRGIQGNSLHPYSQIVGLTDKFSSMITERSYREALEPWKAYETVLEETRSTVSPRIFVTFLKSVLIYPRSCMLRLSNGQIGRPVDYPVNMPTRPTVELMFNENGERIVDQRRTVELSEETDIKIEEFGMLDEARQVSTKGEAEQLEDELDNLSDQAELLERLSKLSEES